MPLVLPSLGKPVLTDMKQSIPHLQIVQQPEGRHLGARGVKERLEGLSRGHFRDQDRGRGWLLGAGFASTAGGDIITGTGCFHGLQRERTRITTLRMSTTSLQITTGKSWLQRKGRQLIMSSMI